MKYNNLLYSAIVFLMTGCNATLYQGYSDELYSIPEVSDQYTQERNEKDSRTVQTIENDLYSEEEESRLIYDTEESNCCFDSNISFSIMGPGFYAGIGSHGWGGWFYPYFGPHVAYHYSPWYWDPFWNNSFYSWYWNPYIYDYWYHPIMNGYWWNHNYTYWSYNNGISRTSIDHRQGTITHRQSNTGQLIRKTAMKTAIRQSASSSMLKENNFRGEGKVNRKPQQQLSFDREVRTNSGIIVRDKDRVANENQLSNDNSTGRVTYTRESKPFRNQNSISKPIQPRVTIGGDTYKPSNNATGNHNYNSNRPNYKGRYEQNPVNQNNQIQNSAQPRIRNNREIKSGSSNPARTQQGFNSPSRSSSSSESNSPAINSGSRGSSSPRGNSGKSFRNR